MIFYAGSSLVLFWLQHALTIELISITHMSSPISWIGMHRWNPINNGILSPHPSTGDSDFACPSSIKNCWIKVSSSENGGTPIIHFGLGFSLIKHPFRGGTPKTVETSKSLLAPKKHEKSHLPGPSTDTRVCPTCSGDWWRFTPRQFISSLANPRFFTMIKRLCDVVKLMVYQGLWTIINNV